MTTITIADELIEEANRFGWNEKTLTDEFSQFIRSKISLMQFRQSTKDIRPLEDKKTLSIDEVRGCLKSETNITATVEEMNEGSAKMFENWEG